MFENEIMHHSIAHSDAEGFFRAFRYDAHPMSILTSAFASMGSMYSEVCHGCSLNRMDIVLLTDVVG